jgi:hypothetical protein
MANTDSFKVEVWLLLVVIIAALIFIGTLVFTTDEVTADQLSSVSAITYLPIFPGLIAMLVFVRPRTIKRCCYNTKQSSSIVGILFGTLLFFAFLLVPDPNNYTYYPWPHKWVHVYCNHALLWMHLDQAEKGCHPGPESRYFMADLQMLARYPLYSMILNAVPYSYALIAGVIVFYLITRRRAQTDSGSKV